MSVVMFIMQEVIFLFLFSNVLLEEALFLLNGPNVWHNSKTLTN